MSEYLRYFEYGKIVTDKSSSDFVELSYSDEFTARLSADVRRILDFNYNNLDLSVIDTPKNNKFIGLLPFQEGYIFIHAQLRRDSFYRSFRQYVCVFLSSEEIRSYFQKGIPLYSLLIDITGGEKNESEGFRLLKIYSAPKGKVQKKFPSLIQSETIKTVSLDTHKLIGSVGLAPYRQKERIGVSSSKIEFNWVNRLEIIEQTQMILCETAEFFQSPSKAVDEILTFVSDGKTLRTSNAILQFTENTELHGDIQQLVDLDTAQINELGNFEAIRNLKKAVGEKSSHQILQSLSTLRPFNLADQKLSPLFLDLSGCHLNYIPPQIQYLTQLIRLNLANNQIRTLPPEIGSFHGLEFLNLSENNLSELPIEIKNLGDLKWLNIAKNKFTALPLAICELDTLEYLGLSDNAIEKLPQEILKLDKLKQLDVQNIKLPIPAELLERPDFLLAALTFQSSVLAGKPHPLAEIKMLVVGQGSVGKTSLIKRLTEKSFSQLETKTEGIVINHWKIKNTQIGEDQPEFLRINIWDFGGQEIMHATHQFFLTKRSLYLLVLDARLTQEENRVEYWLKMIESFGSDSPILLVGNKTDQHLLDINRTGLQKKYPNIVSILETSAATGKGLDELQSAITKQVNALPHVRDAIPEAWFNLKAQLEKLGQEQNYISLERYEEKCAELEVKDELSQRTLIGFLHDLGIVLHFQDDPRLESLGILNPQWATNGVYKILNAHALFQNKGVLERSMLADILPEDDYPANKRLFVVDMMRKFELCYDIVPEQTFLVPDLLPKDEPYTGEWDGTLAFQYHYNVLPSSIVSRFIVRMNAYIYKTIWRAGVVLQKDGNKALVKADTEEKKIYVWVNGAEHTRRDFLSVIRADFDAIHKTIIKIEAVQKVPHPEYPNLVLDYAELLQFERDNIAEFPRSVDGKTVMVNVRQLLNGIRVGSEPAPVAKSVPPPAVAPVNVETASVQPAAGNQSLLVRILFAVFVSLPRVIGRFALDIFGRDKALDSTAILLGYVLIVLSVLAVWGIVDVNSLRDWFAGWWRFFFPVK